MSEQTMNIDGDVVLSAYRSRVARIMGEPTEQVVWDAAVMEAHYVAREKGEEENE